MSAPTKEDLERHVVRLTAAIPGLREMGADVLAETCEEVVIYLQGTEDHRPDRRFRTRPQSSRSSLASKPSDLW